MTDVIDRPTAQERQAAELAKLESAAHTYADVIERQAKELTRLRRSNAALRLRQQKERFEMAEKHLKVKSLDCHRNGVCGLGFHVGIVEDTTDGRKNKRDMLVIRFDKQADKDAGQVVCAAFDLALLDKREIRFFHNSWRGDYYHTAMDAAIEAAGKEP